MNLGCINELCVWIMNFPGKMRGLVAVGVTMVIWGSGKCLNNTCFRNNFPYDPRSVIARAAHIFGLGYIAKHFASCKLEEQSYYAGCVCDLRRRKGRAASAEDRWLKKMHIFSVS